MHAGQACRHIVEELPGLALAAVAQQVFGGARVIVGHHQVGMAHADPVIGVLQQVGMIEVIDQGKLLTEHLNARLVELGGGQEDLQHQGDLC